MRIAYISETWPPEINGVALTAARTVAWLRKRGHAIDLIRPRRPPEQGSEARRTREAGELRPPSLPLPFYREVRFGFAPVGQLRRRFLQSRAELVHVATPGPLGFAAARAARGLGLPLTSDFRTNFHQYSRFYGAGLLRPVILAYLRHFHNLGSCTFVPTAASCAELREQGFERLELVGRGVDDELFSPDKRCGQLRASWRAQDPGVTVVLCVGRLAPEKNLGLVLDAIETLRGARNGLRMVVVGDGPQRRRLQERHPQVIFAGWRRGEDLARHYASADLFVQPSRSETFGNVTIEAMASGLPVLAFRSAAAAQYIRHMENGFLLEESEEDRFAAALHDALAHPERLRPLGACARQAARALRWDAVLAEFESILERTIQNVAQAAPVRSPPSSSK